jgi:methionyl-tRNA formyltransferase
MRLAFFGTPAISVPTLRLLAQNPDLRPLAVFTQPSARRSRRGKPEPSEVSAAARELGLVCHEVESVNEGTAFDVLKELAPDVIVVVSFGQILKKRVLELPRHGCLNLHPSALPRYRGAAPIQRAVMAGERTSALTVMRLVKKLDAGPILAQQTWELGDVRSSEELMSEAAQLGAVLMRDVLARIAAGEQVPAREQNEALASYAPPLVKADGVLDFCRSSRALRDLVRGVQPWPRASCELLAAKGAVRVIVHAAEVRDLCGEPGQVVAIDKSGIVVACGAGALALGRVQLEGKSVVSGRELANGLRLAVGARFMRGSGR